MMRRLYAAVTSQLRKSSRTPSQYFLNRSRRFNSSDINNVLGGLGSVRIPASVTFSPDSERVRLRDLVCAKTATTTVDRKRSDTFCVWCSNGLAPSAARRQTISLTRSTDRH